MLDVLGRQLMAPDVAAAFVIAFNAEWNRLIAEHGSSGETCRRELQAVERKIGNLIDAVSEGIRSPDLKTKLADLEARRTTLQSGLAREAAPPPAMHPNIAHLYHDEVARLSEALQGPNGAEAREAARELIEQVIISPPEHDDDPPRIEVVGELVAMLKAAGLGTTSQKSGAEQRSSTPVREFGKSGFRGRCRLTGFRADPDLPWDGPSPRGSALGAGDDLGWVDEA